MTPHDQHGFDIRFGWGGGGVERLARAGTIVVVDVLSFSTAVDVAVEAGAAVYPHRFADDSAAAFAAEHGAFLAVSRRAASTSQPYSLSPPSLRALRPGDRLVLPSPNGATLSLAAAARQSRVLTGCLRNAAAVGGAAAEKVPVNMVAAGERWPDGSLRPAFEDLVGAGAIISALPARLSRSPEAAAAASAFENAAPRLESLLLACGSGRELADGGWDGDIVLAGRLDESRTVPELWDRYYADRPRTARASSESRAI